MKQFKWVLLGLVSALLLAVVLGPCMFLPLRVGGDLPGGTSDGFAKWARERLDVEAIRQWSEGVSLDSALAVPAPKWWPACPPEGSLALPIPRADWPLDTAAIKPEEVWVLADRSGVILTWHEGAWGFTRMVAVGRAGGIPPLNKRDGASSSTPDGLWVYIRSPG